MLTTRLLTRLIRKWCWWKVKVTRWWNRRRFILSCRLQGVKLEMGDGVQFYHPVRVYGEGGKITLEDGVKFAFNGSAHWLGPVGLETRSRDAELLIGRGTIIMREARIICFNKITIGSECAIGDGCLILDSNAHDWSPGNFNKPDAGKPIELGNRVHVGPDATILKGVKIGDDTTISTRSVVLGSLPSRCVAMGNPARVLHQYPPDNSAASQKLTGA